MLVGKKRPWKNLVLSAVMTAFLASEVSGQDAGFGVSDPFDEKLALDWKPIRHDEDRVSLTKNPGKLTITTQHGTLGLDETVRGPCRNLYLIENPANVDANPNGDFAMTTSVSSFRPTMQWQQAGLLIYDDDDNYLKYDIEYDGANVIFKHMRETQQVRIVDTDNPVPEADRVWIRIIKRGNVYERAYSIDGVKFTKVDEKSWRNRTPERVGLIATNGTTRADSIDAAFDFFEVRELTADEKNDARYLVRKKITGKWSVVSSEFNGAEIVSEGMSDLEFDGGYVSFTENGEEVSVEVAIDPTQTPSSIVMSAFSATAKTPANGIYQLIDDRLTICLSLKEGVPAPTELATVEGDSRILLKLSRVAK